MTGIDPTTRQRARRLRAGMTPQERILWARLRELNRMLGLHFRRQAPIGPFIADFADLGRRLVIEVDGGGHGGDRDVRRNGWLEGQGFQVLRFWNRDVSDNPEGVMQVVLDALDLEVQSDDTLPPSPIPSPRGGGEVPHPVSARNAAGLAPPSPLVGEGGGGGAVPESRPPGGGTP